MKVCPSCKVEYHGGEAFCPVDAARLITASQFESSPQDADDPLVGTTLQERYRVIRRIGEGGMGLVYEGEHTIIEKRVAIKVLRDDFSSKPDVVQRFRQEAKSATRIGHENIVDISDFGETPSGASYFIMEYLEGSDLADVLETEVTLSSERVVEISLQCCAALGAAHDKGIVHRDMKPENIFMQRRSDGTDFVKIVDFGIAKMSEVESDGAPGRKLTKTGMIFGTPEYMSPEQASGKELDHRVDIYAMGVILYELLTGSVPFVGDSFMGVLTQHMFDSPAPLHEKNPGLQTPAALEQVVYRAMAKEPDERFQTMAELAEALTAALEGRVIASAKTQLGFAPNDPSARSSAQAVTSQSRTLAEMDATARRKRGVMMASFALLLLLGGGAFAMSRLADDADQAEEANLLVVEEPTADEVAPGGDEAVRADGEDAARGEGASARGEAALEAAAPLPEAEPPPELPSTVRVTVETVPGGASVTAGGDVEGCAPTPCDIEAPLGALLELSARKGRMQGSAEVTPENETTVQIALVARRTRGATTRPPSMTSMSSMTSGGMRGGDLKIPDIFR